MNWNELATLLMIAEKLQGHPQLKALRSKVQAALEEHNAKVEETNLGAPAEVETDYVDTGRRA